MNWWNGHGCVWSIHKNCFFATKPSIFCSAIHKSAFRKETTWHWCATRWFSFEAGTSYDSRPALFELVPAAEGVFSKSSEALKMVDAGKEVKPTIIGAVQAALKWMREKKEIDIITSIMIWPSGSVKIKRKWIAQVHCALGTSAISHSHSWLYFYQDFKISDWNPQNKTQKMHKFNYYSHAIPFENSFLGSLQGLDVGEFWHCNLCTHHCQFKSLVCHYHVNLTFLLDGSKSENNQWNGSIPS